MVCVATIPAIPPEKSPTSLIVVKVLRANKISYVLDGSVAWGVYVPPQDADKARSLLRRSNELAVISERNGVLQLEPR